MNPRIRIFVGAYGSGKTEVALNYTFLLCSRGERVAIADLDIVNPYFRSRELADALTSQGVHVLAPEGELATADLPVIVPGVKGYLQNPDFSVVLDVGGDDAGSLALSRFAPVIAGLDHEMLMVVNNHRPWTGGRDGITAAIRSIEKGSRLRVSGMVSNPNLGEETTPDIVERGHAVIRDTARALNIPVVFLSIMAGVVDGNLQDLPYIDRGVEVLELRRRLLPPWYEQPLRMAPQRDQWSRIMLQEVRDRETSSDQIDHRPS